jgi:acyl dehydratase
MIDRKFIGYTTAPTSVRVDGWRVRLFCEAIGETDPVYWDAPTATAAGHRGIPVPPTFLKALEGEHFNSAALMQLLEVPVRKVLHAEQSFEHLRPVHVGDEVEITRTVSDLFDKRNGELSFVVVETTYRVLGAMACRSVQTVLVRNRALVEA